MKEWKCTDWHAQRTGLTNEQLPGEGVLLIDLHYSDVTINGPTQNDVMCIRFPDVSVTLFITLALCTVTSTSLVRRIVLREKSRTRNSKKRKYELETQTQKDLRTRKKHPTFRNSNLREQNLSVSSVVCFYLIAVREQFLQSCVVPHPWPY